MYTDDEIFSVIVEPPVEKISFSPHDTDEEFKKKLELAGACVDDYEDTIESWNDMSIDDREDVIQKVYETLTYIFWDFVWEELKESIEENLEEQFSNFNPEIPPEISPFVEISSPEVWGEDKWIDREEHLFLKVTLPISIYTKEWEEFETELHILLTSSPYGYTDAKITGYIGYSEDYSLSDMLSDWEETVREEIGEDNITESVEKEIERARDILEKTLESIVAKVSTIVENVTKEVVEIFTSISLEEKEENKEENKKKNSPSP